MSFTKWQGPNPQLMSLEELKQWFDEQNFSPNDEIGKVNYAYGDPVAQVHNQRDRSKGWDWVFSNIDASITDTINGGSIEIELDEPYQTLYELLPGGEDFQVPLIASVFKDALMEVLNQFPKKEARSDG